MTAHRRVRQVDDGDGDRLDVTRGAAAVQVAGEAPQQVRDGSVDLLEVMPQGVRWITREQSLGAALGQQPGVGGPFRREVDGPAGGRHRALHRVVSLRGRVEQALLEAPHGAQPELGEELAPRGLPLVDVHRTVVTADADTTWRALTAVVEQAFTIPGARPYARLVRCADTAPDGPRPLAAGSTIPGFHVAIADPGVRLVLAGHHAFSHYTFAFDLHDDGRRTVLSAETRAAFPGRGGRLYRLAVIGTRGHVVVVRGLLARVRQRAERQ